MLKKFILHNNNNDEKLLTHWLKKLPNKLSGYLFFLLSNTFINFSEST